ncbi:MAG: exodeoxyribonuclease VII large subunit [Planctomycetota bacterium]|nr:exodeoxyribonuclease VII large subunit [Planctomycetota bacterium]
MSSAGDGILTVSELTSQIQGMLSVTFEDVFVQGEISQPRASRPGHVYLTLKDAGAVLPAVIWRSTAGRLRYQPEDGLEVIARGYIDVYPPHGRYQLIIRALEPVGAGALQLAFEQLRAKLEAEGLFDPAQKQELPFLPRRIALVTSRTGAAVRDLVSVIRRRLPGVSLLLLPVRVQGEGAAAEIVRALRVADTANVDVIVAGRGGGSIEDLWAFNEEVVARAIAACATPVVSAVGHESDVTIADLVADVRAATPSQAGELVVPDAAELLRRVEGEGARLGQALRRRVDRLWQQLEALAERAVLRDGRALTRTRRERLDHLAHRLRAGSPRARLRRQRERVRELGGRLAPPLERRLAVARDHVPQLETRLGRAAATRIERHVAALRSLEDRLRALSPLAVLGRGYSLTSVDDADGGTRLVRRASDVRVGDRLRTRLSSGAEVASEVTSVEDAPAPASEDPA